MLGVGHSVGSVSTDWFYNELSNFSQKSVGSWVASIPVAFGGCRELDRDKSNFLERRLPTRVSGCSLLVCDRIVGQQTIKFFNSKKKKFYSIPEGFVSFHRGFRFFP